MRYKLQVVLSERTGVPYAEVPSGCMWDLVEYLSYQRVAVSYEYHTTHFGVTFLRTDLASAQRLLDEWAESPAQLVEVG